MNMPAPENEDAIAEHAPPVPRLRCGVMELLPMDRMPLDIPNGDSLWCLPGGRVVTTRELLRQAKAHGVELTLILNKETTI